VSYFEFNGIYRKDIDNENDYSQWIKHHRYIPLHQLNCSILVLFSIKAPFADRSISFSVPFQGRSVPFPDRSIPFPYSNLKLLRQSVNVDQHGAWSKWKDTMAVDSKQNDIEET
jgi:hypothetical protein